MEQNPNNQNNSTKNTPTRTDLKNNMLPLMKKDLNILNLNSQTSQHQLKDMEFIQMPLSEQNKFEDISKADKDQRFVIFKMDSKNADFRDYFE